MPRKFNPAQNLTITHPEISKQWHSTKNGELTPDKVSKGMKKLVWWICPKGHEYDEYIYHRSKRKLEGCPYCTGKRVCNDNCLKSCYPEVAKQWHPTKNGELTPDKVAKMSCKKVWWICKKKHEWQAKIAQRTFKKNGCPYCSGRLPSEKNSLSNAPYFILREWHKDNPPIETFTISTAKKAKWECYYCDYIWVTNISTRAVRLSGCPNCYVSKGEMAVRLALEENDIKYIRNKKFDDCKNLRPLPFDFYVIINKKEYLIEFDGDQHNIEVAFFGGKKAFKQRQKNDNTKTSFCEDNNIPLLRLTEKDYSDSKITKKIIKFLNI
jgi:hypothetical protein